MSASRHVCFGVTCGDCLGSRYQQKASVLSDFGVLAFFNVGGSTGNCGLPQLASRKGGSVLVGLVDYKYRSLAIVVQTGLLAP